MKQLIARTLILACCTAYVSPFGAAPAGGPSCCECTEPAPTACLLDPVLDTDVDCHLTREEAMAAARMLNCHKLHDGPEFQASLARSFQIYDVDASGGLSPNEAAQHSAALSPIAKQMLKRCVEQAGFSYHASLPAGRSLQEEADASSWDVTVAHECDGSASAPPGCEPKAKPAIAVALGGGGMLAMMASAAVGRALYDAALWADVRFLSSCSGAAWFTTPFVYSSRFSKRILSDDPIDEVIRGFGNDYIVDVNMALLTGHGSYVPHFYCAHSCWPSPFACECDCSAVDRATVSAEVAAIETTAGFPPVIQWTKFIASWLPLGDQNHWGKPEAGTRLRTMENITLVHNMAIPPRFYVANSDGSALAQGGLAVLFPSITGAPTSAGHFDQTFPPNSSSPQALLPSASYSVPLSFWDVADDRGSDASRWWLASQPMEHKPEIYLADAVAVERGEALPTPRKVINFPASPDVTELTAANSAAGSVGTVLGLLDKAFASKPGCIAEGFQDLAAPLHSDNGELQYRLQDSGTVSMSAAPQALAAMQRGCNIIPRPPSLQGIDCDNKMLMVFDYFIDDAFAEIFSNPYDPSRITAIVEQDAPPYWEWRNISMMHSDSDRASTEQSLYWMGKVTTKENKHFGVRGGEAITLLWVVQNLSPNPRYRFSTEKFNALLGQLCKSNKQNALCQSAGSASYMVKLLAQFHQMAPSPSSAGAEIDTFAKDAKVGTPKLEQIIREFIERYS